MLVNPNTPTPEEASPSVPPEVLAKGITGPLALRVVAVLEQAVNPSIASHGGRADLVAVDEEDGRAYVRLSGGCQGCAMSQMTLRQGIETTLLEEVPELNPWPTSPITAAATTPSTAEPPGPGPREGSGRPVAWLRAALSDRGRVSRARPGRDRRGPARRAARRGSDIAAELARRRLGYGRGPRMRFEADEISLVGGIRHGRTLGSPVAIEIANTEWPKWTEEMSPEPGAPAKVLTQPVRATPTCPACSSTASTTPATCSNGPRPARPPPGWPPAPRQAAADPPRGLHREPHIALGEATVAGRQAPARPGRPRQGGRERGALLRPGGGEGDGGRGQGGRQGR